jgi:hypothetical protein
MTYLRGRSGRRRPKLLGTVCFTMYGNDGGNEAHTRPLGKTWLSP